VLAETFENPAQLVTGRRGYFTKRASVSLSAHRRNLEPFADVTMHA